MITLYRTDTWRKTEIVIVEVEKERQLSIWINGRMHRKLTSSRMYHNSWEKAKVHLLQTAERAVENCESELAFAKEKLSKIRKL